MTTIVPTPGAGGQGASGRSDVWLAPPSWPAGTFGAVRSPLEAVVVGAGPNGLTAAARLALAGWQVTVFEAAATVGGGSRTAPFGAARADVCAAVHPFGAVSPAFAALDLAAHGLRFVHPPLALAHPFDDGTAAELWSDLARTVAGLGDDGGRWCRVVGATAQRWEQRGPLLLQPVLAAGLRHPIELGRFGLVGAWPATLLARVFRSREARALLGGLAAHTGADLAAPFTAAIGVTLAAAAHAAGMPFAAGGSQTIVDALAAVVRHAGGEIVVGHSVGALAELPPARAVLLDVTPGQLAALAGRPPPRWRHGVAATKLDLLLSGPLPWTAPACRSAGTVHLGGDLARIAASERATIGGAVPDDPYVIVAQPSLVDPSRAGPGRHVVWAYRHVPNGDAHEASADGIERQFDRFAPGWRDLVVDRRVTTAAGYAAYNQSYVGGDIAGGAMTPWQTIARPRLARDPYRTAIDGVWLCSQSTPPGPGVHGMCGWHAAGSVLASR
jgi:phytoene dehydrogenase-like protein